MTPRPHPRASWPSNDDTTGFNLIVILLGCGLGAYLLWTNYHQAISAAVMALAHQEILLLGHFTNRFQVADRQMAAADPAGVTLRDLYGIGRAIGLFVRIPATAFILLLAGDLHRACRTVALQTRLRSGRADARAGVVVSQRAPPMSHGICVLCRPRRQNRARRISRSRPRNGWHASRDDRTAVSIRRRHMTLCATNSGRVGQGRRPRSLPCAACSRRLPCTWPSGGTKRCSSWALSRPAWATRVRTGRGSRQAPGA